YSETQLATEILTCENENMLNIAPQTDLIIIKRWLEDVHPTGGLDITEPSRRQNVLEAFFKIRKHFLQ
ncbi:6_t:CDS:2, partial [Scutellospora calospora]